MMEIKKNKWPIGKHSENSCINEFLQNTKLLITQLVFCQTDTEY